jgi:cytochrome b subunit of formate dehydrogenase
MHEKKVLRHSWDVRLTHWLIAGSGLLLIFSGMGELPMYKRYNVVKVPGLHWSGDFELNLILHYLLATVFTAAVFYHLVYHWRRREFALLPQKGDVEESVHIVKAMLTGGQEPPHGKYLAEQRLAYAAIAVTVSGLVGTGLIKAYKNLGAIVIEPTLLQIITLLHTGLTMAFMALIVAHVAAFVLKANRPLFPAMFTGRVDRAYAEERHPRWQTGKAHSDKKEEPSAEKVG